jgi:hypothetical protein
MLPLLASHICVVTISQAQCKGSLKGQVMEVNGSPVFGGAVVLSKGETLQTTGYVKAPARWSEN